MSAKLKTTSPLENITPHQRVDSGFFEIIENANVGILVHRNYETLYINDYQVELLGYDNKEDYIKNVDHFDIIHPDDRAYVHQNVTKRTDGDDAPIEYEFRAFKKNGDLIWASCRAFKMIWNGEPALTAMFKDITAEKTDEVELNKIRTLFETTLELCPEIITITDFETGEYIMVNQAFTNFMGMSKEEALGKTSNELNIYPNAEYRDKLFKSLEQYNTIKGLEIEAKNKAGEYFIGVFNATRISVDGRDLILFMGHDQTKERMIHSHLKRSLEEADIANQTKNELLANMSHELRTPLNAILGFSDFIRMELIGPVGSKKYLEYATWIHDSGNHLLEIINDVLDLSKIENKSFELDRVNINFHLLLNETLPFIQSPLQRKSQSLTLNYVEGDPIIDSDSRRIKQIILNILSNAIKFTPEGGEITITTERTDDNYLSIAFKDNGIGMSESEIQRAREPFGRSTTSQIKNQEGTGLGLPLCISFIEILKGTIDIKSEKDEGTEITIKLPLAVSKD